MRSIAPAMLALAVLSLPVFSFSCTDSKIAGGSVDGPAIFRDACARCHGPEGVPTRGMMARTGVKPLNTERVRTDLSDEEIHNQILRGSSNKMMPAFQGALSDEQVAALVVHIRSLGAAAEPSKPAPTKAP